MARRNYRRRAARYVRRNRGSIITTAKKFIRIGAWLAPEAATVLQSPNAQGAIKALTLKSGFDLTDGSFSFERGLMAWAPGITYEALDAVQSMARKFIRGIRV